MDTQLVLLSVFTYRHRGAVQNSEPILFTDFDIYNLRMFEIMPPPGDQASPNYDLMIGGEYFGDWNDLSKWSIHERPITEDEFREINEGIMDYTNGAMSPLGYQLGEYKVQGYIRRPRIIADEIIRRWTSSLNIVEVTLAKGDRLER